MSSVVRAAEVFFGYLAAIQWRYVGLALGFHFLKMAARAQSWRNILAASYPDARVRWRTVFASYAAGVGVNALLPARGGDLLKLYLIRHRIEGAAYATLATTLVVETLFDFVLASALLLWALQQGVLPGLEVLPRLPEWTGSSASLDRRNRRRGCTPRWLRPRPVGLAPRRAAAPAFPAGRRRPGPSGSLPSRRRPVAGARLGMPAHERLLLPACLRDRRESAQRPARAGDKQPLDCAAADSCRHRNRASAPRLRVRRHGAGDCGFELERRDEVHRRRRKRNRGFRSGGADAEDTSLAPRGRACRRRSTGLHRGIGSAAALVTQRQHARMNGGARSSHGPDLPSSPTVSPASRNRRCRAALQERSA